MSGEELADRAAQQMLADRGRFPSGGDVPFDVAISLIVVALRGRNDDQQAATELVEWWDTGILRDGVVRAEAQAMLDAGKADRMHFIQQAERAIIDRIVRRAALHQAREPRP